MSYLKLRELWNECEKLDLLEMGVFIGGLTEIANAAAGRAQERISSQAAKPCVAQKAKADREKWTPAEEDALHKYCNEAPSVAKGVARFLRQTNSERSPGACKLRVSVMRREGRW